MMSIEELSEALFTCIGSDSESQESSLFTTESYESKNFNAFADPSLPTTDSNEGKELSSDEESIVGSFHEDYEVYSLVNTREKERVLYGDSGNVLEFNMVFGDRHANVVDSMECLRRLENVELEPVHFNEQYYLDIPKPKTYSIEDLFDIEHESASESSSYSESELDFDSDVQTAELGPPYGYLFPE